MHFLDEGIGAIMAIISAFFAAKAAKAAEGGEPVKIIEIVKEVVAQKMPAIFGLGYTDERLIESLRQLVPSDKRRLLDLVLAEMRDYEADIFRQVLTGMPCGSEIVGKPVGKKTVKETVSWEFTDKDLRVQYLIGIADEVQANIAQGERVAAALVVANMRARRVISRNPALQAAHNAWAGATAWVKANILDFLGVNSYAEITDNVLAAWLNRQVERLVQQHPEALSLVQKTEIIGGQAVTRQTLQVKFPSYASLVKQQLASVLKIFKFWR